MPTYAHSLTYYATDVKSLEAFHMQCQHQILSDGRIHRQA